LHTLFTFLGCGGQIRDAMVLLCVFYALGSAIEELPERALNIQNKIILTH
jgi:hypothetical protein